MSRPRQRVCLQHVLKLDLNRLALKDFVKRGANIGGRGITWTHSNWGEIASGLIGADMNNDQRLFRNPARRPNQWITLIARPRHFGGRQWSFVCPVRSRLATVLWKPNGATRFCSRQTWSR
jgi:hypothetical protein